MQYQTECLQQEVTIEFLPHGSDMPYRIVTINNPIIYTDPTGHFRISGNIFGIDFSISGSDDKLLGAAEMVAGFFIPVIGPAVVLDGANRLGFNVNGSSLTDVAAFGNGGGGSGDFGFEYVGPGSGGRTQNISSGGFDRLDPVFYNRLELTNPYNASSDISFNLTVNFGDYLNNPDYMFAGPVVMLPGNTPDWIIQDPTTAFGGPFSIRNAGKGVAGHLFGKSGLLNSNRYLRMGFSRFGGDRVFRLAGDWIKLLPKRWHDKGHIILRNLGPLKKQ